MILAPTLEGGVYKIKQEMKIKNRLTINKTADIKFEIDSIDILCEGYQFNLIPK